MSQGNRYEVYRRSWQKRFREKEKLSKVWNEQALVTAKRLAKLLVENYGANKVVLFGSVARGDYHFSKPDIDLVVAGLPVEAYFDAQRKLEKESGFSVDLIPMEDMTKRASAALARDGRTIYDFTRS